MKLKYLKKIKNHPSTYLILFLLLGIFLLFSCSNELSFRQVNSNELSFSKDTIYLDTVFTNIGSSTYTLKVYNKTKDDIQIPNIYLENGESSNFRLNVDGISGKNFNNVEILARDSMYVFIETTVDIKTLSDNETQFLYEDKIKFSDVGEVNLMTLVLDAIFLYPKKNNQGIKETIQIGSNEEGDNIEIEGFYLNDDQLIFTSEKPYVIYGYMAIPSDKKAIFEAGSRLYFHENSGIIVANNASISINGELSNNPEKMEGEVIFQGDRLESEYDNIPGQWGTVWLTFGSKNHIINNLTIKNASIGILVDGGGNSANENLILRNTQIHNSSYINLWAKNAFIRSENSVFGNAGQYSFLANLGGNYSFTHCTFANFWDYSYRSAPSVFVSDFILLNDNSVLTEALTKGYFENCIIDGNQPTEYFVEKSSNDEFNLKVINSSIKFNLSENYTDENSFFDWQNENFYSNIFLNKKSSFINIENNNFGIDQNSEVLNKGSTNGAYNVPKDINGFFRNETIDLGAYQHVIVDID